MIPGHTRKILVVRLSARGDLVFASPLAGALRRSYPEAHIAWAAEARTTDVIRQNPHLDEVIIWDRAAWKRMFLRGHWNALLKAVYVFADALRSRRFDVVIDAQGLLRSGAVALLSGAPVRIGLGSREGSPWLMTKVVERGGDSRQIGSEYLRLASILGLESEPFSMEIPRSPAEVAVVARIVKEEGLERGFIVTCPFTTRSYKHWFEDRWTSLIRDLRERTGLGVVLLGSPADRAAAERILGEPRRPSPPRASGPLVNLVGRTTLGEASAIVSRCSVLVGVDTGLSHMAHAYGRPAVLLFGSNTPYLDPPGPAATILHSGRSCSPCRGKLTCGGRIDCMDDLSVGEVLLAVESCLAENPPAEAAPHAARKPNVRAGPPAGPLPILP